jgi:hypothetical protein
LFAAAWLGLDYIFSLQSGWRTLAERYPASSKPAGPRVRWQVVRLGPIPETGVTNMIPSPQGLYLYAGWLYRCFRSPILVPWSVVSSAREVRELWWKRYELAITDVTRIRMSRRAYQAVEPFLAPAPGGPPNITLQRTEARDARLGR